MPVLRKILLLIVSREGWIMSELPCNFNIQSVNTDSMTLCDFLRIAKTIKQKPQAITCAWKLLWKLKKRFMTSLCRWDCWTVTVAYTSPNSKGEENGRAHTVLQFDCNSHCNNNNKNWKSEQECTTERRQPTTARVFGLKPPVAGTQIGIQTGFQWLECKIKYRLKSKQKIIQNSKQKSRRKLPMKCNLFARSWLADHRLHS